MSPDIHASRFLFEEPDELEDSKPVPATSEETRKYDRQGMLPCQAGRPITTPKTLPATTTKRDAKRQAEVG
jgi:hypothetical protein